MKKIYLKEILRLENDLINYFKGILDEIKAHGHSKIPDTGLVANFLVYSAIFGVLRRWALKPLYTKEQIIAYLMNTQLKIILPHLVP